MWLFRRTCNAKVSIFASLLLLTAIASPLLAYAHSWSRNQPYYEETYSTPGPFGSPDAYYNMNLGSPTNHGINPQETVTRVREMLNDTKHTPYSHELSNIEVFAHLTADWSAEALI